MYGLYSSKATFESHATVNIHGKNMRSIGTLYVFLPQGKLSVWVESYETIHIRAQRYKFSWQKLYSIAH